MHSHRLASTSGESDDELHAHRGAVRRRNSGAQSSGGNWWLPEDHSGRQESIRRSQHTLLFEANPKTDSGSSVADMTSASKSMCSSPFTHHVTELEESIDMLRFENAALKQDVKRLELQAEELREELTHMQQLDMRERDSKAPAGKQVLQQTSHAPPESTRTALPTEMRRLKHLTSLRSPSGSEASDRDAETDDTLQGGKFRQEVVLGGDGYSKRRSPKCRVGDSASTRSSSVVDPLASEQDSRDTPREPEDVARGPPSKHRARPSLHGRSFFAAHEEILVLNAKLQAKDYELRMVRMECLTHQARIGKMREEIVKLHHEATSVKTEIRGMAAVAQEMQAQRDELRMMLDAVTQDFRSLQVQVENERNQIGERVGGLTTGTDQYGQQVNGRSRGSMPRVSFLEPEAADFSHQIGSLEQELDSIDASDEPEKTKSGPAGDLDYKFMYETVQAELEAAQRTLRDLLSKRGVGAACEARGQHEAGARRGEHIRSLLAQARAQVGQASERLNPSGSSGTSSARRPARG